MSLPASKPFEDGKGERMRAGYNMQLEPLLAKPRCRWLYFVFLNPGHPAAPCVLARSLAGVLVSLISLLVSRSLACCLCHGLCAPVRAG